MSNSVQTARPDLSRPRINLEKRGPARGSIQVVSMRAAVFDAFISNGMAKQSTATESKQDKARQHKAKRSKAKQGTTKGLQTTAKQTKVQ